MSSNSKQYGGSQVTAREKEDGFKEAIEKEEFMRELANVEQGRPYGSWLGQEALALTMNYFNTTKKTRTNNLYDRAFDPTPYKYDQKLRRDDRTTRHHLRDLAEAAVKEKWPVTSASIYGKRPAIDPLTYEHVRKYEIRRNFYRNNDVNIPRGPDRENKVKAA